MAVLDDGVDVLNGVVGLHLDSDGLAINGNQTLLVTQKTFLVQDVGVSILNGVVGHHRESDGIA